MPKLSESIDIDAPIETVFDCIDDDETRKRWMIGLSEISYDDGQDPVHRQGTAFRMALHEGGHTSWYDCTITTYAPPNSIAFRMASKQYTSTAAYTLSSLPSGGTRVENSSMSEQTSLLAKIMGFLFAGLTRSIMKKHMRELKAVAEEIAP